MVRVMLEGKNYDGSWPSEAIRMKKVPRIEYPPSGGYSEGGRVEFIASDGLSKYFQRQEVVKVNKGNNAGSRGLGVCGLTNIGNTCYMNASLQALVHCAPFVQFFISDAYLAQVTTNNVNSLVTRVGSLVQMIHSGRHSVVTPGEFKIQLGIMNRFFKGFRQHDAEEFVSFLLDKVGEESNRESNENEIVRTGIQSNKMVTEAQQARVERRKTANSFILDTFEGLFASAVKCSVCKTTSTTYDPFLVLSLAIPSIAKPDTDTVTIEDCFSDFSSEEPLDGENKWYCSKCNVSKTKTLYD